MSEKNAYRVRLMRWGDSSSSGRTVTLKLPDDTDEHPFKGLPVGAKAGQLMEIEVVLIDGDGDVETLDRKPAKRVIRPAPTIRKIASPTPASSLSASQKATPQAVEPVGPVIDQPPPSSSTASDANAAGAENPKTPPAKSEPMSTAGGGHADAQDFGTYANQMGNAAEALAAVAEKMTDKDDQQIVSNAGQDEESDEVVKGRKAVVRATKLCKAVDNHRSGFFYFMRSLHPQVAPLPGDNGDWTRDSKATRDRVCHHCATSALDDIANNTDARKKFEDLELQFEKTERLR